MIPYSFEWLWTRFIGALVIGLTAFLVITEWDGLVRFVNWLIAGIAAAPTSFSAIVDHYTNTPAIQWIPSLVIGALVGIVGTAWATLKQMPIRRRISIVDPPPDPLTTLEIRAVESPPIQREIMEINWRFFAFVLFGGVVGALGSQILSGTLRHCTEAPDIESGERIAGWVIAGLSSLILLVPYWSLIRRAESTSQTTSGYFRHSGIAYAFLAPTLISLAIFLYYPSVQTILLSLNARRFPLPQERFVCLANYGALLQDVKYQSSLFVTAFVTVAIVIIALSLALGIAILASQKIRGAAIYRTLLIFPFALSPIVTGVIFLALFREGGAGLINYVLNEWFGVAPSWLRDPILARWVIVAASVWNVLGFNILFYIAGLQNVPKDLLESAQIDGANPVQRFARITFPLLSPYTFFLLVTNITYSFYGIYGAVDALTQGGPPLGPAGQFGGATSVLIFKLYEDAFTPGSPIGQAAAQAQLLFLGVAALTVLQFRFVERRVTYGE